MAYRIGGRQMRARVGWIALLLLTNSVALAQAEPPPFSRGIAILASNVGTKFPVEALLEFVDRGHLDPVVIDWAWITMHWGRTNFGEVNRLVAALQARGLDVPAMYRPRFTANPTVPYQQKADGSPAYASGYDICFGSEAARTWGAAWGKQILEKCPGFREIIIYDPRNQCQCRECAAALAADPQAPKMNVWRFMTEAKALWRTQKADVKLGVNFVTTDLKFWEMGRDILDVARPYLFVLDNTDMAADVTRAEAVRALLPGKTRACLAKITWGDTDKVAPDRLADFDRRAREHQLPYFLWLMETPFFEPSLYDPQAVCQALGLDWEALRPPLERMGLPVKMTPQAAQLLVQQVAQSFNYASLSGLNGAAEPVVQEIINLFESPASSPRIRFVAAVALSYTKSPLAVPPLLRHAGDSDNQTRLGVAMALGYFRDDTGEIRKVLTQLAETDPWNYQDPKTGTVIYAVRENARMGLARLAKAPTPTQPAPTYEKPPDGINPPMIARTGLVDLQQALAGKVVTLVNVGDVIRLRNTGPALQQVEFDRYFPVVDAEQVVLGRWMAAYAEDRTPLPVAVTAVREDSLGNLIQTLRLARVPANQTLVIVANSLVARRERPLPQGAFPVLPADQYPPEVRPFLAATPTIQRDLPEIRAIADELLSKSHDTLDVARGMAAILHAKPGIGKGYDSSQPMAVNVLNHGGLCCVSAITAVAILRACGIPAQVTYTCTTSYIHGITRLYLSGYGWLRIETTCGSAKVPYTEREADLGFVRLYDLTMEGEAASMWGWPYMHFDEQGRHPYRCNGQPCLAVKIGRYVVGILGSGSEVLGGLPNEGVWTAWDDLVKLSREAVRTRTMGEYTTLLTLVPGAQPFATMMPEKVPAPKGGDE
jgi:hypothetical protein